MAKFIQNGEEISTIQFPITEINTTSTVSFTVENEFMNKVELVFFSEDKDVTINDVSIVLDAHESKHVTLSFFASDDRFNSLTPALKSGWGFREIIGE